MFTKHLKKSAAVSQELPRVGVVIVSYNTATITQQAVTSVLASENVELTVCVVDNASSDRSLSQLRKKFDLKLDLNRWQSWQTLLHKKRVKENYPNIAVDVIAVNEVLTSEKQGWKKRHTVEVYPSNHNLGFGRANNLAAAGLDTPYVFFLNSDTTLEPDTIQKLVAAFDQKATQSGFRWPGTFWNIGAIGAELHNVDGSLQLQGGVLPTLLNIFAWIAFFDDIPGVRHITGSYQHHREDMRAIHRRKLTKVGWVGGTALMVKRDCLDEVGGFDPHIFMYGEDVEWCLRATKKHWDVLLSGEAKVTHLGSASSGQKNAVHGEISGLLYIWQKHRTALNLWILRHILRFGLQLRVFVFGILKRYGEQRVYREALELV